MPYTWEDIIVNPKDSRLEGVIGQEVYYHDAPTLVLEDAKFFCC